MPTSTTHLNTKIMDGDRRKKENKQNTILFASPKDQKMRPIIILS